jgi:regulatory protein
MREGAEESAPAADPEHVARLIILQRLATSDRPRAELAEVLRRKLVPDDVAHRVLDRFTDLGLINDAGFARAWVESRHAGRGLSRRALRIELQRKGVAVEHIDAALTSIDDDAEYDRALAVARRKIRPGVARDRQLRRLHGLLTRKGYDLSVASRVARAVVGEEQEWQHDAVDESDTVCGAHDLAADEQPVEHHRIW